MINILLSALTVVGFVHFLYFEFNDPAVLVVSAFFSPMLIMISYLGWHVIGMGLTRIYRLIIGLNEWYQSFKEKEDDFIVSGLFVIIIVGLYWAIK